MQLSFVCPVCRGTINAPASLEGEAYPCPKCKADVDRWPAPLNPPAALARPGSQPPPAEKAAWYYSVNGSRRGPVTSAQLKSLVEGASLRANDLVWREGMPAWVEAGTVPELFPDAAQSRPAPPPVHVAQPARPADNDDEEDDRRSRRRDDRQAIQVNVHQVVERDEEERRPRRRRRGGFRCPYCGSTAHPLVRRQVSATGWLVFVLLLIFTVIFCFIGLFIQEDVYTCRDCGARV